MQLSILRKARLSLPESRTFLPCLICCLLFLPTLLNAQSVINPVLLESVYATNTTPLYTLNSDMLEMSPGKQVQIVAFDQYQDNITGTPPRVVLKAMDFTGATDIVYITAATESKPDVVLANNLNSPGQYIVCLVYLDTNNIVRFDTYDLLGAGTGVITLKPRSSAPVSSARGTFPHIDMFTDINNPIGGLPSMHKFAISYGQFGTAPFNIDIYERHGDVSSPTIFSSPYQATFGWFCTDGADIAVTYDPVANMQHAYFAINNGTPISLTHLSVDINATVLYASPVSPVFTTLYSSTINSLLPRIEAMGVNYQGSGIAKWVIGSIIPDPVTYKNQIWAYSDLSLAGYNCTASSLMNGDENLSVAVCAGPGFPYGNVCNDNYNIGWHNAKYGYITQVIDATTGSISAADPDYYKANMISSFFTWIKVPIALSSCSNSGNDLFTTWWDNMNTVYYKLKPNITGYKPGNITGIGNVINGNRFVLYPNPATDKLMVNGLAHAHYSIVNIIGQVIKQGQLDGAEAVIDISRLSAGNYTLTLQQAGERKSVLFVKQ